MCRIECVSRAFIVRGFFEKNLKPYFQGVGFHLLPAAWTFPAGSWIPEEVRFVIETHHLSFFCIWSTGFQFRQFRKCATEINSDCPRTSPGRLQAPFALPTVTKLLSGWVTLLSRIDKSTIINSESSFSQRGYNNSTSQNPIHLYTFSALRSVRCLRWVLEPGDASEPDERILPEHAIGSERWALQIEESTEPTKCNKYIKAFSIGTRSDWIDDKMFFIAGALSPSGDFLIGTTLTRAFEYNTRTRTTHPDQRRIREFLGCS